MALAHAILAALTDCPCSGYDLAKRFDGSVGFFWNATHQQIYRELTKLEEQNQIAAELVAQTHRPDKKIYAIAERGIQTLKTWIETPGSINLQKDELLVKIFAGSIVSPSTVIAELQHHRKLHLDRLDTYGQIATKYFVDPSSLTASQRCQFITLRQGIRMETEWLAWCEEAIALLSSPISPQS
jgi:DNA-binding PadR family transcriptional regulator